MSLVVRLLAQAIAIVDALASAALHLRLGLLTRSAPARRRRRLNGGIIRIHFYVDIDFTKRLDNRRLVARDVNVLDHRIDDVTIEPKTTLPYTLQEMADYLRTMLATLLVEIRTIGMHFIAIFDEPALRFVSEIFQ